MLIPYLVHLAVGRDKEKPVVVILLDSDDAGRKEKNHLLGKGKIYRKPLLREEYILQIGDLNDAVFLRSADQDREIEDLIPVGICLEAFKHYVREINVDLDVSFLSIQDTENIEKLIGEKDIYEAIQLYVKQKCDFDIRVDKVGFARNVLKSLEEYKGKSNRVLFREENVNVFVDNFKQLFYELNRVMAKAQQRSEKIQLSEKISRAKNRFLHKHSAIARREEAIYLLQDIENILDDSYSSESAFEIEKVREVLQNLKTTYKLDIKYDVSKHIDDYQGFLIGLDKIKYAGDIASQEEESLELNHSDSVTVEVVSKDRKQASSSDMPKTMKRGKNSKD